MYMTNYWLAGLSLALSVVGYLQNNPYAVKIGILCFFCVLLAQFLTPKHPSNLASLWTLYLSRLWGWCCVLFMAVVVIDQIISGTSLHVPVIDVAWDMRYYSLLEVLR